MTRKHFIKLAELIKDNSRLANVRNNPMHVIERGIFLNQLCDFLKSENANFDVKRFKEATGEIDWDLAAMRASQSSWKDEWLTLLFSIPLVLSFMGEWGRGIVADGFTALAGMPQWYQIALGAIVSASFATRSAGKFFNGMKKK